MGGGLTAERRAFREGIRLQAGMRFAAGEKTAVIAKDLRVSVRSVERWRRAWRGGGMEALRSTGPANSPIVTDAQFAIFEEELGKGPAAHGFEDQRWTLARVQTVIRRRFKLSLSVAAAETARLVLAGSRPPCSRTRRARGGAVEEGGVAAGKRLAAVSGAWIVFEDEAGFSMTPPRARTWGRAGVDTPLSSGRGAAPAAGPRSLPCAATNPAKRAVSSTVPAPIFSSRAPAGAFPGRTTATFWSAHTSSSTARLWWSGTISTPTWPPD